MSTTLEAPLLASESWQLKVLPFMTRAIATMGLLFFLSSFVQIHLMRVELALEPQIPVEPASLEGLASDARVDLMRWNGLVALERESLRSRTRATNAVILRQASLLHLGFLTGTLLCLVGAVFVLGRLQEPSTSLSGQSQRVTVALNTSSPGIVLAVLGVTLICATLFHHYQFNLPNQTVYIGPVTYPVLVAPGAISSSTTGPKSLQEAAAVPPSTSPVSANP